MAMGVGEGEGLSNNLIFTWAFVELMMWFWVCCCFVSVLAKTFPPAPSAKLPSP